MTTGDANADFGGGAPAAPSGNPGQSLPSNLVANPLDDAGVQRISEGAAQFKALAESGGFTINDEAFKAYEKVCDEFLNGYGPIQRNLFLLTTRAQMGNSDYAKEVADFNSKVANGDPQSLIPNLELLKNSFEQVKEALVVARNNYRKTDGEQTQNLSNVNKADS
ncbi:hypothetical protein [Amycolatopsis sp. FDAARGOS 1241]|uniref:hypothetical protein n=1 Tax=Amycolatopsis sp. FDAARGOS 1241 TaxID=2778070 RepID=UPI0019519E57|nr:hypothetical protein [Amycolatopsis sp. FDAARGOS 1241]QRP46771.1 hypothetical protein I6J71_01505 [Amycolatopsis sp. FDAARGOS 1241]